MNALVNPVILRGITHEDPAPAACTRGVSELPKIPARPVGNHGLQHTANTPTESEPVSEVGPAAGAGGAGATA